MNAQTTSAAAPQLQQRRAFWLRHLHQWHWISSALCLVAMLAFAASGITLNHAADIEAHPVVTNTKAQLPPALLATLTSAAAGQQLSPAALPAPLPAPLPAQLRHWLEQNMALSIGQQAAEWSAQEIYVALPRSGGDAWLRIELDSGKLEYEKTERGWVAYLNDLHKGRNTGSAWTWFIDFFAFACLVFCLTGVCLLQIHARQRKATWPVLVFGLVVPLLLAIGFIH
ncbi:PepSY-associated TM helix domain-containing protein [soil metagenome]